MSFPFELHSATVFHSLMQSPARPCRHKNIFFTAKAQRGRGTAHACVDLNRPFLEGLWATCKSPYSASSGYHADFYEGCYRNAYKSRSELWLAPTKINYVYSPITVPLSELQKHSYMFRLPSISILGESNNIPIHIQRFYVDFRLLMGKY